MGVGFAEPSTRSIPIWFVTPDSWSAIRDALPAPSRSFAQSLSFQPDHGKHACLPGADGALAHVIFAIDPNSAQADSLAAGALPTLLPGGVYRFANLPPGGDGALADAALAWLLGSYRYTEFRESGARPVQLLAPEGLDAERLRLIADAVARGRDLINAPANVVGPQALEDAAISVAETFDARVLVTRGEGLLQGNFPLIHAVGRAAAEQPRLVDFVWGPEGAIKVVLIGKGVCFDSGGLDLKPASAMALMKKDMAGAATALAAAEMVMAAALPVRLRVLIPIVENSISAPAFRPGDIYRSRCGATVEIGNTDAEGRLILADALSLAQEDDPDLILDFATLTGAARVALGPDLPAFFTPDEALASEIASCGNACVDPVWRLPLWRPYDSMIDSKAAHFNNVSASPFAGAIVAALFLARFVSPKRAWAHFDLYGWTPKAKPGRPEGGEVQTARLVFELLEGRVKGAGPNRFDEAGCP